MLGVGDSNAKMKRKAEKQESSGCNEGPKGVSMPDHASNFSLRRDARKAIGDLQILSEEGEDQDLWG